MRINILILFGLALTVAAPALSQTPPSRPGASPQAYSPDPQSPRPIEARDSVWIEQLTWMEIRDAIRSGKTTIIIPTGGVEQNGPYLVTGKHNVILSATAEAVARKLGDALVAPIVPFVPEGMIEPPADAMLYPGTISVEANTYTALLRDIARSLNAHGFKRIVFIGDSGGNQEGMKEVAEELNKRWGSSETRALFIPEYFDLPARQQWLAKRGYREVDEGLHDELSAASMMLSVDPHSIRMNERVAAGKFTINGVALAPTAETVRLGRALIDHIAEVTAQAIRGRR
jgi:creatinine amidohydrolase/Fe(II)-dependent formamide hydrolase-like protein